MATFAGEVNFNNLQHTQIPNFADIYMNVGMRLTQQYWQNRQNYSANIANPLSKVQARQGHEQDVLNEIKNDYLNSFQQFDENGNWDEATGFIFNQVDNLSQNEGLKAIQNSYAQYNAFINTDEFKSWDNQYRNAILIDAEINSPKLSYDKTTNKAFGGFRPTNVSKYENFNDIFPKIDELSSKLPEDIWADGESVAAYGNSLGIDGRNFYEAYLKSGKKDIGRSKESVIAFAKQYIMREPKYFNQQMNIARYNLINKYSYKDNDGNYQISNIPMEELLTITQESSIPQFISANYNVNINNLYKRNIDKQGNISYILKPNLDENSLNVLNNFKSEFGFDLKDYYLGNITQEQSEELLNSANSFSLLNYNKLYNDYITSSGLTNNIENKNRFIQQLYQTAYANNTISSIINSLGDAYSYRHISTTQDIINNPNFSTLFKAQQDAKKAKEEEEKKKFEEFNATYNPAYSTSVQQIPKGEDVKNILQQNEDILRAAQYALNSTEFLSEDKWRNLGVTLTNLTPDIIDEYRGKVQNLINNGTITQNDWDELQDINNKKLNVEKSKSDLGFINQNIDKTIDEYFNGNEQYKAFLKYDSAEEYANYLKENIENVKNNPNIPNFYKSLLTNTSNENIYSHALKIYTKDNRPSSSRILDDINKNPYIPTVSGIQYTIEEIKEKREDFQNKIFSKINNIKNTNDDYILNVYTVPSDDNSNIIAGINSLTLDVKSNNYAGYKFVDYNGKVKSLIEDEDLRSALSTLFNSEDKRLSKVQLTDNQLKYLSAFSDINANEIGVVELVPVIGTVGYDGQSYQAYDVILKSTNGYTSLGKGGRIYRPTSTIENIALGAKGVNDAFKYNSQLSQNFKNSVDSYNQGTGTLSAVQNAQSNLSNAIFASSKEIPYAQQIAVNMKYDNKTNANIYGENNYSNYIRQIGDMDNNSQIVFNVNSPETGFNQLIEITKINDNQISARFLASDNNGNPIKKTTTNSLDEDYYYLPMQNGDGRILSKTQVVNNKLENNVIYLGNDDKNIPVGGYLTIDLTTGNAGNLRYGYNQFPENMTQNTVTKGSPDKVMQTISKYVAFGFNNVNALQNQF